MTILKLKSQNSALHIKVASLETKMEAKLDSVIKSLVEIKEDLALFKKAEIEVLKELVKPRK